MPLYPNVTCYESKGPKVPKRPNRAGFRPFGPAICNQNATLLPIRQRFELFVRQLGKVQRLNRLALHPQIEGLRGLFAQGIPKESYCFDIPGAGLLRCGKKDGVFMVSLQPQGLQCVRFLTWGNRRRHDILYDVPEKPMLDPGRTGFGRRCERSLFALLSA